MRENYEAIPGNGSESSLGASFWADAEISSHSRYQIEREIEQLWGDDIILAEYLGPEEGVLGG